MNAHDMTYLQENRHVAERLMIFLEDRRLLRDRTHDEDEDYCRKSADELRSVLANEMLNVQGNGPLLASLREMRNACTNFVSAAGPKSAHFKRDPELFRYHLQMLREVFARRVLRIVADFDLAPSDELAEIMRFAP